MSGGLFAPTHRMRAVIAALLLGAAGSTFTVNTATIIA